MCDRLIELPDHGRLIVVTDLHGDFDDYSHYLNLWDETDPDFHIVFCGDLIHGIDEDTDGSVEILDDAIARSEKYSNFHTLLGNHEWAHITKRKSTKIKGLCFRDLKISFHIGKDALNLTLQIISNSLRQCLILSRLPMECSFLIQDLRTRSDLLKYFMSLLTADIPVQFCMIFCGIGMTEQLTIQEMMSIGSLILSAQKLWLSATVR